MKASSLAAMQLVVHFLAPIGPEEESALLAACTLAHDSGSCSAAPASEESGFRATVESTSTDHVLLEVAGTDEHSSLFASREMSFRPEDDRLERARSIGLALGVLATTLLHNRAPPEAEKPRLTPKRSASKEQVWRPRRALPPWFFGVGGGPLVAPALGKVGPSGGILGRFNPLGPLSLQARIQGWILSAHEAPRLLQLSGLVGAGALFPVGPTTMGSSLSFGAELLRADMGRAGGTVDHAGRVVPLIAWEATWGVSRTGFAWFFLTPQAAFALSPTELFLNGQRRGTTGSVRLSLHVELAWASVLREKARPVPLSR